MGNWKVVVPEAMTNEVINPSFEVNVTDGWTDNGMVTFERSTTRARFGVASIRLVSNAATDSAIGDTVANADAAETWTASCWVWVVAGDFRLRIQENAGGWTNQASITTTTTGEWVYLEVTTTLDGGVTDGRVVLLPASVAASEFFVDAVQFEEQSEATTYCDGDQPGCEWNGAAHNSASQRPAVSRAGGFVRDFKDDYNFGVSEQLGAGNAPVLLGLDEYALLPGGQLNSAKIKSRPFTLIGTLKGDGSDCDIHQSRQDMISILSHDSYPKDSRGWQPVIIRYTGADVDKEIEAHYEGGLEGALRLENKIHERLPMRFLADDPFWREIGESATVLDTNDSATVRLAIGRLRSTGQWDELGPPDAAGGPYTIIYAIAVADDGTVYFGGTFSNFDNIANADNIVSYTPSTDTWAALGTGTNGSVLALAFGPDGTLYVGGNFAAAGGVANTDGIAAWSGAAWSALGTGVDGATGVEALLFGSDGNLYAGGTFATMSGVANTSRIASWDGAAWSALGTGANSTVLSLGWDNVTQTLYAGGIFATIGGSAFARIAQWDGTAWAAMQGDANSDVRAIDVAPDGTVYAGGTFTAIGSVLILASRIAFWNGTSWFPLGSGVNGDVESIRVAPDGIVYVGGAFTEAGGITLTDRVAKWNGSAWAHLDLNLPGAPTIEGIDFGPVDPVVPTNYDVWLGFDVVGAANFSGTATVTNDGTAHAYPKIVVSRSGGTSAVLEQIRNETLGLELLFDYSLLDGETLTIDLAQTQKSIVSNFFGARADAVLKNSDFGEFSLQPGANQITAFVNIDGATVVAYMLWRDPYKSND